MDPRMIPKGSAPERPGDMSRRPNQPGVYYHPQANKFIETSGQKLPDGSVVYSEEEGQVQGDAFTQIGYRKANEEELKEYRAVQEAKAKAQRIKDSQTTTVLSSNGRK